MILKNLIPSDNPIKFRAHLAQGPPVLTIAFFDASTGCQTHDFKLRFKTVAEPFRWLVRSLQALFDEWPTVFLTTGFASGQVKGDRMLQEIFGLGQQVILTEGVWSPWFTGRAAPFVSRHYPLGVWLASHPLPEPSNAFSSAIIDTTDCFSQTWDKELIGVLLSTEYVAETHPVEAADYFLHALSGHQDVLPSEIGPLIEAANELIQIAGN